jgi:hypothetical protein
MRRILTPSALAALAIAVGGGTAPAQQPVVTYPQPTYYQPATPAYRPAPIYYAARPVDNRAVLPAFAPRGGIGTTPYLGNTRGLGGYSVNYDAAPRATATPARRGWLFRRPR